ncbi:tRNA (N6-threonylcarbamoyladenosine(37)-N6)-methyltransferase TrmO [Neptuniibacter sp. QD48_55]|uniref:tRNA (N6-threonylcarbamoyladenosine(37)-N6)-methyltransferase TrmO n=1 Tax=Neptuniibacter sp. QD48_55 TaxID=3398212 RepID=UPI0039F627D0
MPSTYSIAPIAVIRSPYKEKFGIPRQPNLAKSVTARVEILEEFSSDEIVRGLENCSHIWLVFLFSECIDKGWKPTVRPPRLGGNKRLGVFATRSPFRPNPIGLSPVRLVSIEKTSNSIELVISGADLLDGTPVIDIKPYLPYSDIISDAEYPMADQITLLSQPVIFSEQAQQEISASEIRLQQPLKQQLSELLQCDPRPAYKKNDAEKNYGIKLHDLNVRFRITDQEITVDSITVE